MSEPNVNAIHTNTRSRMNVKTITSLGMLTAISYVVMLLSKALPQVSGFLQLDLKDTVMCIGGFIFGPVAAAAIAKSWVVLVYLPYLVLAGLITGTLTGLCAQLVVGRLSRN